MYGDNNYVLTIWDKNSPLEIGDNIQVDDQVLEIAGMGGRQLTKMIAAKAAAAVASVYVPAKRIRNLSVTETIHDL